MASFPSSVTNFAEALGLSLIALLSKAKIERLQLDLFVLQFPGGAEISFVYPKGN